VRARLPSPAFLLGGLVLSAACGDRPPDVPVPSRASVVERLTSPDVKTRIDAARALKGGGDAPAACVEPLASALSDRNRDVREAAAEALRDLGPRAAPALPALRKAFLDEDDYVRWRVAEAFGRIGALADEDVAVLAARAVDAGEAEVVRGASARALERVRAKRNGDAPAR